MTSLHPDSVISNNSVDAIFRDNCVNVRRFHFVISLLAKTEFSALRESRFRSRSVSVIPRLSTYGRKNNKYSSAPHSTYTYMDRLRGVASPPGQRQCTARLCGIVRRALSPELLVLFGTGWSAPRSRRFSREFRPDCIGSVATRDLL